MATERILIVDDEETLCEVLKLNLENEGYDVDIAFSAEQALTYNLKSYSLILLDIMMGEISGIKMAKMLKANMDTAEIPIIFCTARDSEDDMVMGLNLGADDYIVKPYTIRNVIARVKSVLSCMFTPAFPCWTHSPTRARLSSAQPTGACPPSPSPTTAATLPPMRCKGRWPLSPTAST